MWKRKHEFYLFFCNHRSINTSFVVEQMGESFIYHKYNQKVNLPSIGGYLQEALNVYILQNNIRVIYCQTRLANLSLLKSWCTTLIYTYGPWYETVYSLFLLQREYYVLFSKEIVLYVPWILLDTSKNLQGTRISLRSSTESEKNVFSE